MRTQSLAAALLLSLSIFACGGTNTGAGADTGDIDETKSSISRDTAPQVSSEDQQQFARNNAEFALALFKESAKSKQAENLMQSPLSISTVLSMVHAGANGETKSELANVLRYKLPEERLRTAFNWLDLSLESRAKGANGLDGKPAKIGINNQIFSAKDVQFAEPYLDTLAQHYGAGVKLVDFGDKETVGIINSWVSERTEQRIPQLLSDDSVNEGTRLVLVNTVYLSFAWQSVFDAGYTSQGEFAAASGKRQVPMMFKQQEWMPYAKDDTAQIVELALSGGNLVLDVILPKAESSLADFEAAWTADALQAQLAALQSEVVRLSLPKFKLEPVGDGSLKNELKSLGLSKVFDSADLTTMMPQERGVHLSDVVHKTFFSVSEGGVEAAAATATPTGGSALDAEVMRVDRPFIVVLRDKPTGQLLFIGHINEP